MLDAVCSSASGQNPKLPCAQRSHRPVPTTEGLDPVSSDDDVATTRLTPADEQLDAVRPECDEAHPALLRLCGYVRTTALFYNAYREGRRSIT